MKKEDQSKQELRQELAESANKIGVTKTSRLYGINLRTVVKWQQRYNELGSEGLVNYSRKDQHHPGKLDVNLEKSIIDCAGSNPEWSALRIKKELNLNCTVNTIIKKLTTAGLYRKTKSASHDLKCEPLRNFMVSIQKTGLKLSNLPEYRICFTDITTGYSFVGFTRENTALSAAIFADYFLSYLKMSGFDNLNITLYIHKTRILSSDRNKSTIFEEIVQNKHSAAICRNTKDLDIVDFKGYNPESVKTDFDLFYLTVNQLIVQLTKGQIGQVVTPLNLLIAPILTDNYIKNFDDIRNKRDFWHSIEIKNEKKINQVLNAIINDGEEKVSIFDNRNAAEIYSQLLILLNTPQNREKYYGRSLIMTAKILYHRGEWSLAEKALEKSLLITKNDSDLRNYFKALALNSTIKTKMGSYARAETILKDGIKYALAGKYISDATVLTGKLGQVLQRKGEINKALFKYKKQLELARSSADSGEIYESLKNLAGIHSFKAGYNNSSKLLTEALVYAESEKNSVHIAECNGLIGENYFNQSDLDQAMSFLEKEMVTAKEIKHQDLLLHSYGLLGLIFLRKADYVNSEKHLEKHLLLAEKLQNHTAELQALRYLGTAGWYMDDRAKAFRYFRRYYKMAIELKDMEHEAIASGNLGVIYGKSDRFAEALKYHKKQYQLAEKMENRNMLCTSLNNMGVLYLDAKDYKNAILYFRKLLKSGSGVIDQLNVCITYHNIALSNLRLERYMIAFKYFNQAIDFGEKYNYDFYLSEFYTNFSTLLIKLKRFSEAKVTLSKAGLYAKKTGRVHISEEIEKMQMEVVYWSI